MHALRNAAAKGIDAFAAWKMPRNDTQQDLTNVTYRVKGKRDSGHDASEQKALGTASPLLEQADDASKRLTVAGRTYSIGGNEERAVGLQGGRRKHSVRTGAWRLPGPLRSTGCACASLACHPRHRCENKV